MLRQQLTAKPEDMSGQLIITAAPGALVELQGLAQELALRPTIETDGSITIVTPMPDPPPVILT